MARDDFTKQVIDALAKRAGYLCCNPDCRDPFTSLPHSHVERAINLGVGAHIKAASPLGPRFDKDQPAKERKAITNGIWLCQRCAAEVDRDTRRYTVPMLMAWKEEHEAILANAPLRSKLFANGVKRSPTTEGTTAATLLNYLADKRMLFEGYAWEVPRDVLHSVMETRATLVQFLSEAPPSSNLHKAISHLQDTYYTFLRHAGDLSSRTRLSDMPLWEEGDRLRFALSALRKSCGFQISDIAAAYNIRVPTRLQSICPTS